MNETKNFNSFSEKGKCNLYVIGNGFDLHHKIPAQYSKFRDYCKEKERDLYDQIVRCVKEIDDLWCNFETALGKQKINPLLKESKRNLQIDKDYPIGIDQSNLNSTFGSWAVSLKKYIKDNAIQPTYLLRENSYFLSFNYTDTLEYVYKIAANKILHIHGYIDSSDELAEELYRGYIYGHNRSKEEIKNEIDRLSDIDDITKYEIIETISDFQKRHETRELESWLSERNEISNIIVLGHSMDVVDEPYFQIINRKYPNAFWEIGWHGEDDQNRKEQRCRELGIKNFIFMKF